MRGHVMRKWLIGIGAFLVTALLSVAGYVLATSLRSEHPVGFQTVEVQDPDGKPFQVGIWYPTNAFTRPTLTGLLVQFVAPDAEIAGKAHPLIILSHGIAGSLGAHADTALALADAGFVVAAPLHTGDNYKDQSAIGTKDWFPVRARQAHLTISYMLDEWRGRASLDADKIGMFGFSGGGTTALIALGALPDPEAAREHCAKSMEFGCQLWKSKHEMVPDWRDLIRDPRIKAAVIIAPGAGFAFGGYATVPDDKPVQLWAGEKDESVPTPSNAEVVHKKLPRAEWHLVPNAGHFSFMVPCGPVRFLTSAPICKDPQGFDRAAFHKAFNTDVVTFFEKTLAKAPRGACIAERVIFCIPLAFVSTVKIAGLGFSHDAFGRRMPASAEPPDWPGLKINIMIPDYIVEYSRIGTDVACSAHWCLYYRKECDDTELTCHYLILDPVRKGSGGLNQRLYTGPMIQVQAHSEAAFRQLQSEMSLGLYEWESPVEYLPLSALSRSRQASGEYPFRLGPTECNPWKQTPGCQRPVMEGKSPADFGLPPDQR